MRGLSRSLATTSILCQRPVFLSLPRFHSCPPAGRPRRTALCSGTSPVGVDCARPDSAPRSDSLCLESWRVPSLLPWPVSSAEIVSSSVSRAQAWYLLGLSVVISLSHPLCTHNALSQKFLAGLLCRCIFTDLFLLPFLLYLLLQSCVDRVWKQNINRSLPSFQFSGRPLPAVHSFDFLPGPSPSLPLTGRND